MNTVELQHKLNILQRQGPIYTRCIRQKLLYETVAFCLYCMYIRFGGNPLVSVQICTKRVLTTLQTLDLTKVGLVTRGVELLIKLS